MYVTRFDCHRLKVMLEAKAITFFKHSQDKQIKNLGMDT